MSASSFWTPKLLSCPTCKKKISFNALSCPNCGEPITDKIRQNEIKTKKIFFSSWAVVVVIVFIFLLIIKNVPPILSDKDLGAIINEFPQLTDSTRRQFAKDIQSVIISQDDSKDSLIRETGNKKIDKIISIVNNHIYNKKLEIAHKKREAEERIEKARKYAETKSQFATRSDKDLDEFVYAGERVERLERDLISGNSFSLELKELERIKSQLTTLLFNINPEAYNELVSLKMKSVPTETDKVEPVKQLPIDKQSPLYKLGYDKGSLFSKKYKGGIQINIKDQCIKVMEEQHIKYDNDYIAGCIDGFENKMSIQLPLENEYGKKSEQTIDGSEKQVTHKKIFTNKDLEGK